MTVVAGEIGTHGMTVDDEDRKNQRAIVADGLIMWAATAGICAPALYFTVMLALGALTPGYDAISRFASDLSIGSLGWIMIANFVAFGALEIVFACGLRQAIGQERSGRVGAGLIGLIGACFIVAGLFVTDPSGKLVSIHGAFHVAAALMLFFVAAPVGGLAFARRFRQERGFALYSAISGLASPPLFIATWFGGDVTGLVERVLIADIFLWLTLLALRLHGMRSLTRPHLTDDR